MDFLPRTLAYYLAAHGYLFFHLYRLAGKRRLVLMSLPLFVVMGLFPFCYHLLPTGSTAQKIFGRAGTVWQPLAFFCLTAFAFRDILRLGGRLRRPFHKGARSAGVPPLNRCLPLLLLVWAGVFAYGIHEAHSLRTTRLTLPLPLLPADAESVRVAFAADLHIGPQTGPSVLRRAVEAIMAQKPDLILLGGDMLDDALQGTPADRELLARLAAPLGVFAVPGNHDAFGGHERAVTFLESCGITVLMDETRRVGPLRLLGIDDPDVRAQRGGSNADVSALLDDLPRDAPVILLAHRPELLANSVGRFDLQLSGHTHGGQIPLLKPLLEHASGTPTGLSRHSSPEGESLLYVTTGVGFSKLPIRLGAPPEVVVIDLTPGGTEATAAS